MMGKQMIPPLKALATLECVVRHRSVSLAAEELCVTHGAVSKQLTTLSAWIGQPLFADNRRRMVPTPAALRLARGVEVGMSTIYKALDEVQGVDAKECHLRVIAPTTLAMYWLIPRLPSLRSSGLTIKAHVRNTHSYENWRDLPFDIAIRAERELPTGYRRTPIFRDELGLVAAPQFVGTGLSIRDLRRATLLESETRPGELDAWLSALGFARSDVGGIETFEHNYIAIEAALMGHGAVAAPLTVIGNHLARGTLVQLFKPTTVPGPCFTALYDPRSIDFGQARNFAEWLRKLACDDSSSTQRIRVPTHDATCSSMSALAAEQEM